MARGKRRDSRPRENQCDEEGWIIDYGWVLCRPQPIDDVELSPEDLAMIAESVDAIMVELNKEIARIAESQLQLHVLPGDQKQKDRRRISADGSLELERDSRDSRSA